MPVAVERVETLREDSREQRRRYRLQVQVRVPVPVVGRSADLSQNGAGQDRVAGDDADVLKVGEQQQDIRPDRGRRGEEDAAAPAAVAIVVIVDQEHARVDRGSHPAALRDIEVDTEVHIAAGAVEVGAAQQVPSVLEIAAIREVDAVASVHPLEQTLDTLGSRRSGAPGHRRVIGLPGKELGIRIDLDEARTGKPREQKGMTDDEL